MAYLGAPQKYQSPNIVQQLIEDPAKTTVSVTKGGLEYKTQQQLRIDPYKIQYHEEAIQAHTRDVQQAGLISFIGQAGITAWNYLRGKRRSKRREGRLKKEEQTKSDVTNILNKIYNTGMSLVDQGLDPSTDQFEKKLSDLLFQEIGYKGNCNAEVWVPGTKPGKGRPVWFRVENNGRTLTPVTLSGAPPNLQSYWYSDCQGAKTDWIREYQSLLTAQARNAILTTQFLQQKKSSMLISGVTLGVPAILGIIILIIAMRSK